MPEKKVDPEWVEQMWRENLTKGGPAHYLGPMSAQNFRALMRLLPKNPRCTICNTPFSGFGGAVVKLTLGRERSSLNPTLCNVCESFARQYQGGAEVELSMLFADVRGSTTIAERMQPLEFSRLIDRFYQVTTDILIEANAWIEKLIGDEVTGLFLPGFVGAQHARIAVETAEEILRATGQAGSDQPWIPVGISVHTGTAYVGSVGREGGLTEITALGDSVNTAARLASSAGPGEILVSLQTWGAAGFEGRNAEQRQLQLKGRSEPVEVRVVRVTMP
jgi:adenylate cyclase